LGVEVGIGLKLGLGVGTGAAATAGAGAVKHLRVVDVEGLQVVVGQAYTWVVLRERLHDRIAHACGLGLG
jgi:hypothetical protein